MRALRKQALGFKIIRRLKQKLLKKGETKNERIMREWSFSYTTVVSLTTESYEHRAKIILYKFLQHTSINFETQQWFIHYMKTVEKLQESWKNYQKAKANRMRFLSFKWDYEMENMIEYWQESKSKKHKNLLRKLENITSQIKYAILDLYYR